MGTPIGDTTDQQHDQATAGSVDEPRRRKASRSRTGRLLDLKAAEAYSGISAWTLRDLIASAICPWFGRRDCGGCGLIVPTWTVRSLSGRSAATVDGGTRTD